MPADRWNLTEYLIKKMEMKDEPDHNPLPVQEQNYRRKNETWRLKWKTLEEK
jgi:hypothetical protein